MIKLIGPYSVFFLVWFEYEEQAFLLRLAALRFAYLIRLWEYLRSRKSSIYGSSFPSLLKADGFEQFHLILIYWLVAHFFAMMDGGYLLASVSFRYVQVPILPFFIPISVCTWLMYCGRPMTSSSSRRTKWRQACAEAHVAPIEMPLIYW